MPLFFAFVTGIAVWFIFDGLTRRRTHVEQTEHRPSAIRDWFTRAGLHDVSPQAFVSFSIFSGVLLAALTQILLSLPIATLAFGGLGLMAPYAYYRRRANRRKVMIQTALADAIERLRDSIRSGLSIQEAIVGVARTGPTVLRPEFARLARQVRLEGFEPAMIDMRDRLADPLFDMVAASLIMNDRVGGRNVTQVLNSLAQSTRAELQVQQEARANQARSVLSAQMIAAVPLVVFVLIRLINPAYLDVFSTPLGQVALAFCFASTVVGYYVMLAVTKSPTDRRVLQ